MPVRKASAVWEGDIAKGQGTMSFGQFSGKYSVGSRFEENPGTNPEELLGAAHAGCFSMALSAGLTRAGFKPKKIETQATVHIEKVGEGWQITRIELRTEADVPGIDEGTFQEHAQGAKGGCPVSKALSVSDISLEAKLT